MLSEHCAEPEQGNPVGRAFKAHQPGRLWTQRAPGAGVHNPTDGKTEGQWSGAAFVVTFVPPLHAARTTAAIAAHEKIPAVLIIKF
jgi:hypothetical protein